MDVDSTCTIQLHPRCQIVNTTNILVLDSLSAFEPCPDRQEHIQHKYKC